VQPDLIGGTIVRVGDYVVDGTLKRKLRALRKSLVAKERMFE
jgi:F0F1-type ATP synthase delta subunit